MKKEAVLYEKVGDGKVKCTACRRYCVLKEGQTGFCGVRSNEKGKLFLTAYGTLAAVHIDPIEKKPVLHAFPNSKILSVGTLGCNFACAYCQNWDMSQTRQPGGTEITPEKLVEMAVDSGCKGIAYTYNEPTIFMEFARDTGKLARKAGLTNIFVTNGYETKQSIELAKEFLDIATVDFKGNASDEFYKRHMATMGADFIFDTLGLLKRAGVRVEITDLVVPKVGDNLDDARKMIKRVKEILGDETPISFLRFFPDYKLNYLEFTPEKTLMAHYKVAKEEGMKYVYVGNVHGHKYENTYCPKCGKVLVERSIYGTTEVNLSKKGECKYCGEKTPILLWGVNR